MTSRTPLISPASTSFSIAWPPVPVAWNTRQSKPCASSASRTLVTHGVVTPNIVMPSVGLPSDDGARESDHPRDRRRRVAEHPARDRVEPGNIDDRIHERDVARPDIRGGVAAGHGRNHDLGQPDRQRPHGRRDQGGAPASADSDHAGEAPGIELASAGTPREPGSSR